MATGVQELSLPFGRRMRVVQLTDIHAGLYMTREQIRRYADLVNGLRPDLFVLTGDYISNSMSFLPGCLEEVARVQARYGTFATLGNHEHWFGKPREVSAVFRRHNIPLLDNAHRVIQTEQGPLAVAGIDDLRTGRPDLDAALHGIDPSIPTLLLSHRPEIFPLAARHGIPLTLAGHWHGGQIKLSFLGVDLSIAHAFSPYPEGLYRISDSRLYVSRGIGTTATPIRLNAPPEVTLFHLS
jgi:predicted MPP superfamily phosphohydrolase